MARPRYLTTFLCLTLLSLLPPASAKDLDATDNKSPSLVSVSLSKSSLVEGEIALVTVVIRDDKNELRSWPVVLFGAPADSPGSISGGVFASGGRGLINTSVNNQFVEQTFEYEVKAPSWPGGYYGFNIQGVVDKNGNEVGFDLKTCTNKNIYRSPQALSFPDLVPTCNTSFTVRLLTESEKAQAKAKAEAEAKAKAEAEAKAKAEAEAKAKAEAEAKAKAEAEAKAKAEAEAKAKAEAEAKGKLQLVEQECQNSRREASKLKDAVFAAIANNPNMVKELSELLKNNLFFSPCPETKNLSMLKLEIEAVLLKAKPSRTTITCLKGKLTRKVTAVDPKCPTGYKKK